MKDIHFYLRVLGLAEDATEEDIRKMYRELAKILHPDRHNNNETAKKKFQELNEAYEFLMGHYVGASSENAGAKSADTKTASPKKNPTKDSEQIKREKRIAAQYVAALFLLVVVFLYSARDNLFDGLASSRGLNNKPPGETNAVPTDVEFRFNDCKRMYVSEMGADPIYFSESARKIKCTFVERYNAFDFAYTCKENPADGGPIQDYELSWANGWRVPKLDNKRRFLADFHEPKVEKQFMQVECNAEQNTCSFLRLLSSGNSIKCSGTYSGKKYRDLREEWNSMEAKIIKEEEIRWSGALRVIPSKFHGTYKAYASELTGADFSPYQAKDQYLLEIQPTTLQEIFATQKRGCVRRMVFGDVRAIEGEIKPDFVQLTWSSDCPGGAQASERSKKHLNGQEIETYCFSFEGKYLVQQECLPSCKNPIVKRAFASCKSPDKHYFIRVGP